MAGHDVETGEHSPVSCTIGGPPAAPPLSSIGAKLAKIHNRAVRAGAQRTRIIRKEESFSTSGACVVDSLGLGTRIFTVLVNRSGSLTASEMANRSHYLRIVETSETSEREYYFR
jgi:hypothetical protein